MKTRRSNPLEVFGVLIKCVLKICTKFTGKNPCQSVISIKLHSDFIEITFWDGCSPVNFTTPLSKNTSGGLLLRTDSYNMSTKS